MSRVPYDGYDPATKMWRDKYEREAARNKWQPLTLESKLPAQNNDSVTVLLAKRVHNWWAYQPWYVAPHQIKDWIKAGWTHWRTLESPEEQDD